MKERSSTRENKKKPAMTLKEKRAAKKAKKEAAKHTFLEQEKK